MGLIERLIGIEQPKLAVHQFSASLGEWERGRWTRAQVIAALGILPAEEAEMDALKARIVPVVGEISIGSFLTLTNVGAAADAIPASKGLGLAYVQAAGISRIEIALKISKVGTGTQTWQLWNETDGSEIIAANDAGVAGDKTLIGFRDFVPPLGAGLKLIRVRAWSTVAADDPIYYGCGITIYRANLMWSKILEEIGVLAEKGYAPLDDAAAVRARLGI